MDNIIVLYIVIGFFLSIDAIIISTTHGLCIEKNDFTKYLLPSFIGAFHIIFPLIFGIIGGLVKDLIVDYSHIISSVLFIGLGISVLLSKGDNEKCISKKILYCLVLAIGVSIDSVAVGISFGISSTDHNILLAALIFGVVSFSLSFLSIRFASKVSKKIELNLHKLSGIFFLVIGVLAYFKVL